jgi:hypothetical protein
VIFLGAHESALKGGDRAMSDPSVVDPLQLGDHVCWIFPVRPAIESGQLPAGLASTGWSTPVLRTLTLIGANQVPGLTLPPTDHPHAPHPAEAAA